MRLFVILFLVFICSCASSEKELKGNEILGKSIFKHDPKQEWQQVVFSLRIQEPRLGNPVRFSEVSINNKNNTFKLLRNRNDKIASYIIKEKGNPYVLLNNQIVTDSLLIKKYLLQSSRVENYEHFYKMMLGLPMSLNNNSIDEINKTSEVIFNNKKSFKVEIKLHKSMFSKHWNLFISKEDFTLLGVEMIFQDDPNKGERLYFEKSIQIRNINIPRVRHWYDLNENYGGSDLLLKILN